MNMTDSFPISVPDRLPANITPCPILEAVFEVRFTSAASWSTLPGLLYGQIREKYPEQTVLPLSEIPENVRMQDPALAHLPLLRFSGPAFHVQAGPRMVSLGTRLFEYPGWSAIQEELTWLLDKIRCAGIVNETERIGVRYIDFFPEEIRPELLLSVRIGDNPLVESEVSATAALRKGAVNIRLQFTNSAIVTERRAPKKGVVLDMDAWFGPLDADLFANGLERFDEAHQTIKGVFFGLLAPPFLDRLKPSYE
jgi:uncharacterized protein (TIGR04255 family)